jgi:hypothetical protein
VLLTTGEPIPAIGRERADLEALKFAIALHRDQVLGAERDYSGEYPLRRSDEYGKYWRTGKKSFSSWMACLGDTTNPGQPHWHSNVKGFLVRNREAAARYLMRMQQRHTGAFSVHLGNAIKKYEAVIEKVKMMDTSGQAIQSDPGRGKLIGAIEEVVTLEREAIRELERAIACYE